MRNTAAAISSLVALLFVVPIVLNFLPRSVSHHVAPYLPDSAGAAFWSHSDGWHVASPAARVPGVVRLGGRADRRCHLASAAG